MTTFLAPFRLLMRLVLPESVLAVYRRFRVLRRLGHGVPGALRRTLTPGMAAALSSLNAEYLPPHMMPLDVAVDVGAFQGHFSQSVVQVLRARQVFAFEPSPSSYALALQRLARYRQVILAPLAIGGGLGHKTFHTYECANGDSFRLMDPEVQSHYSGAPVGQSAALRTGETEVEVTTLDARFPPDLFPELAFVKVDVQGAETDVIEGGRDALRRTRILMIEALFEPHYVGAALFFELHPRLLALGFRLYTICPPWRGADGRAMHTDAVYVRDIRVQ